MICSCSLGDRRSWSKVGTDAKDVANDEATMHLHLGPGGDDYKQHVVMHEFGHVLGLDHEHQSPNADFIDKTAAIQDLTEGYKESLRYSKVFKEELKQMYPNKSEDEMAKARAEREFDYSYKQGSGGEATEYDPFSIMHYP